MGEQIGDAGKTEGLPAGPSAPPQPAPVPKDPFDALMVSPEEAAARGAETPPDPDAGADPEPEGELLAKSVEKICKAVDRLARRGLNLRAVVALLHDALPSVSKKAIRTVLETLRALPDIYGKKDEGPRRRSP